MNITLSIDEELVERARAVAVGRGKSLNQLVRDLLENETGRHDGEGRARLLDELWGTSSGRSGGERFRREDAYTDRIRGAVSSTRTCSSTPTVSTPATRGSPRRT